MKTRHSYTMEFCSAINRKLWKVREAGWSGKTAYEPKLSRL